MGKVSIHKIIGQILLCGSILFILTAMAPLPEKEKGIVGKWKLKIDFNGRDMINTLSIRKTKDGALTAQWGLGGRESELSDLKFENNKLSFVRTTRWGDREFSSNFKANYDKKTDKLSGTLSSDRGDSDVTATRIIPKPPAVGIWIFRTERGDRVRESKLTITQDPNGTLKGKWQTERGESTISEIKFADGKLTFKRTSSFQDRQFESTYEGTIKGNELTGKTITQRGERPSNAKRFAAEVIGRWELTTVSERGERTSILLIAPDLTAVYGMGFGELNAENLKLDADKLSFAINIGFGDRDFSMDFDLKLKDSKLEGEVSSDRGTSKITGKKIVPKPKAEKAKTEEK